MRLAMFDRSITGSFPKPNFARQEVTPSRLVLLTQKCRQRYCRDSFPTAPETKPSMSQILPDVNEWHILENPVSKPSPADRESIHMGPFTTEEECRAVLANLKQIPWFSHGALEVRKKSRRRGKRIRISLPVKFPDWHQPKRCTRRTPSTSPPSEHGWLILASPSN